MSNNKTGGERLRQTMIEKYGSEEAWKQHMSEIAKKTHASWVRNGRKPRGWSAMTPKERSKYGRIGGEISRRGKANG